jgi:hypothetical protein
VCAPSPCPLGTCEYYLVEERGFENITRSFWIRMALNPMTSILIKGEKSGNRHTGRMLWQNGGRD